MINLRRCAFKRTKNKPTGLNRFRIRSLVRHEFASRRDRRANFDGGSYSDIKRSDGVGEGIPSIKLGTSFVAGVRLN